MLVKIKKADVLQSVGFALTAATEEYERIIVGVNTALKSVLEEGQIVPAEAQAEMGRALTKARQHVDDVKLLQRMAEFETGDEVLLDVESFILLEPNLPAR